MKCGGGNRVCMTLQRERRSLRIPRHYSTETMTDQPVSEAYYELAMFGLSTGVQNLAEIPGCWESKIDDKWWVAANGHKVEHECSRGVAVPSFHFYVVYNGWPAGIIGPYGGTIAAGDAANEDALIAALKAARDCQGHGNE